MRSLILNCEEKDRNCCRKRIVSSLKYSFGFIDRFAGRSRNVNNGRLTDAFKVVEVQQLKEEAPIEV